jgi:hypothetical protein
MADDTDIDALVMKARATTRELNEVLEKLEGAGVEVSVVSPSREPGMLQYINRVELGLRFRPRRSLHTSAAQAQQAPLPPLDSQKQKEMTEWNKTLKAVGII